MHVSSPNLIFDHFLESSGDESNKWSNIGFGDEITEVKLIEVYFAHLILSSEVSHSEILAKSIPEICADLVAFVTAVSLGGFC